MKVVSAEDEAIGRKRLVVLGISRGRKRGRFSSFGNGEIHGSDRNDPK